MMMKALSLSHLLTFALFGFSGHALPSNQSEALKNFIESRESNSASTSAELISFLTKLTDDAAGKIEPLKTQVRTLNGYVSREAGVLQSKVFSAYGPYQNEEFMKHAKQLAIQTCCQSLGQTRRPPPASKGD